MKKLLFIAGLLWSAIASAQFVPGQVLTAAELNSAFATKAPIPTGTCLGTSSALNYNLVGNAFSCNGTINAVTLGGATFASPGPIGSVSTSTGAFSSISTPSATIGGGTINATSVGATSASTGSFTTLSASSTVSGAGFSTYLASPPAIGNTTPSTVTGSTVTSTGNFIGSGNGFTIGTTTGIGNGGAIQLFDSTHNNDVVILNNATSVAQFTSTGINGAAIGSTTPSTGSFTILSSTGNFTPSQTNGIVGTTTNNNANAGSVGEYVTASTLTTSATTATPLNATSVSLTSGDWDVTGLCSTNPAATTVTTALVSGISTTSATFSNAAAGIQNSFTLAGFTSTAQASFVAPAPITRVSVASTTTVFLVCQINFNTSTLTVSGFIRARRVR